MSPLVLFQTLVHSLAHWTCAGSNGNRKGGQGANIHQIYPTQFLVFLPAAPHTLHRFQKQIKHDKQISLLHIHCTNTTWAACTKNTSWHARVRDQNTPNPLVRWSSSWAGKVIERAGDSEGKREDFWLEMAQRSSEEMHSETGCLPQMQHLQLEIQILSVWSHCMQVPGFTTPGTRTCGWANPTTEVRLCHAHAVSNL